MSLIYLRLTRCVMKLLILVLLYLILFLIDVRLKKCVFISIDDFLSPLKFVPDWFVTSKIIEKRHTALFADDYILFF